MKNSLCRDCNNQASCAKRFNTPTTAIICTMFVPKLSVEKKGAKMAKSKDTNPKDALGIKKAPMSTLPTGPAYEVALAMLEGARKYGRHNYRVMGVRGSVYYDAANRHLSEWWEGEDIDPDSGLNHITKAIASLFVLRDSMLMKNWTDDRPPRYPDGLNLARLNKAAEEIIKKYPNCVEPFTEKKAKTDSALVTCTKLIRNCRGNRCSHFGPHKFDRTCNFNIALCGDISGCEKVKEERSDICGEKKTKIDNALVICSNFENCGLKHCAHRKPHKPGTTLTPCDISCGNCNCEKVKED